MPDLPQRELRNNVSEVLRAAEAGQIFTVTVGGRPVAQLGPHRPRQWVDRATVERVLAAGGDDTLLDDVAEGVGDTPLDDPWTAR